MFNFTKFLLWVGQFYQDRLAKKKKKSNYKKCLINRLNWAHPTSLLRFLRIEIFICQQKKKNYLLPKLYALVMIYYTLDRMVYSDWKHLLLYHRKSLCGRNECKRQWQKNLLKKKQQTVTCIKFQRKLRTVTYILTESELKILQLQVSRF